MEKTDCIFCKIIKGEIPSHKLYEDEFFIAVLDLNPAAYGHTLIISKSHHENLLDLGDTAGANFIKAAQMVARAVIAATEAESFNLIQNNGNFAGQTVFHFHAHIVPRKQIDGLNFSWIAKSAPKGFMLEMTEKITRELNP
ncbi:MAG: HIT family protein [Defluviitaleaceae bacterium]|nr:HIT family protein [Defluviitaleaceae bacterium]